MMNEHEENNNEYDDMNIKNESTSIAYEECWNKSNYCYFPGYDCQIDDDVIIHSQKKCEDASKRFLSLDHTTTALKGKKERLIKCSPCLEYDESINYRCICHFQMVQKEMKTKTTTTSINRKEWQYAMRSQGEAQSIQNSCFLIATPRIQKAMTLLIQYVNDCNNNNDQNIITLGWTSSSFASSWNDNGNLVVTLHYCYNNIDDKMGVQDNKPLHQKLHQFFFHHSCDWTAIICRSKGQSYTLHRNTTNDNVINENDIYLKDTIYLQFQKNSDEKAIISNPRVFLESCQYYNKNIIDQNYDKQEDYTKDSMIIIPVKYHKPVTAFFHPNRYVMIHALEWILQKIFIDISSPNTSKNNYWMELYCGCGAHSMAISAASSVFCANNRKNLASGIVCLELDKRLVKACEINAERNTIQRCRNNNYVPIHVLQGNAKEFSNQWLRSRKRNQPKTKGTASGNNHRWYYDVQYDILLVDPPRQGLDNDVCEMIQAMPFEHVLYISCGQDALQRDLKVLTKSHYEEVSMHILDLFPRTRYSVETLVHLKRVNPGNT